jgi:hypothetical protein
MLHRFTLAGLDLNYLQTEPVEVDDPALGSEKKSLLGFIHF